MVGRALRNPLGWALLLVAAVLLCASIFTVVPETKTALVVRLGEPMRVANRGGAGDAFGGEGAGLLAHLPLIEQVEFIDKRARDLDLGKQPVLTADGQRIDIEAVARVRVTNPLRMFLSARADGRHIDDVLTPAFGSALRAALDHQPLNTLLAPDGNGALSGLRADLNRAAAPYGVAVSDVRVRRAMLAEGAPLDGALARMRADRLQQAAAIRTGGAQQAAAVRAEGDADAARIYADAFNQDPDFYDFYRSMQSYRQAFGVDRGTDGTTTFVLSPRSEYFRNFMGRMK